ncbi:hypothetical protein ABT56_15365 [Photobacterium aquae]|uniref:Uncharacterized protein n=1 Tax=Photobacterium aquae TaxID=1195763 RepID=A0A0J1GWB3_9GAMM|nr:hypothetical protein [Photobacterium aquae]KLV04008.1 hypothetical protein ABT56_15365 [Photobacterium aquae]
MLKKVSEVAFFKFFIAIAFHMLVFYGLYYAVVNYDRHPWLIYTLVVCSVVVSGRLVFRLYKARKRRLSTR